LPRQGSRANFTIVWSILMEPLAIDFTAVMVVLSVGVIMVAVVRMAASFARRRMVERTRHVLDGLE